MLTFKDLERLAAHYGVPPALERGALLHALALCVGDGDEAFAQKVASSPSKHPSAHFAAFIQDCERVGIDLPKHSVLARLASEQAVGHTANYVRWGGCRLNAKLVQPSSILKPYLSASKLASTPSNPSPPSCKVTIASPPVSS